MRVRKEGRGDVAVWEKKEMIGNNLSSGEQMDKGNTEWSFLQGKLESLCFILIFLLFSMLVLRGRP